MTLADLLQGRIQSLREEIERQEAIKAIAERKAELAAAEILDIELEIVETTAALNVLSQVNLRVDRDEAGLPRVSIDQPLVPA